MRHALPRAVPQCGHWFEGRWLQRLWRYTGMPLSRVWQIACTMQKVSAHAKPSVKSRCAALDPALPSSDRSSRPHLIRRLLRRPLAIARFGLETADSQQAPLLCGAPSFAYAGVISHLHLTIELEVVCDANSLTVSCCSRSNLRPRATVTASPWSEADVIRSHGFRLKWQSRLFLTVDQMSDGREQQSNGYAGHQHADHTFKRAQQSPLRRKYYIPVSDRRIAARREVKRRFPGRKAQPPIATRP
jgi:hypothetical protein